MISTLALALALGTTTAVDAASAVSNASVAAVAAMAENASDEAHYNELKDRLNRLEENCNTALQLADALGMLGSYQTTIENLLASVQTMREKLEEDYAAGLVTADYQLSDLGPAEGQIGGIMGPLNGQYNAMLNACFQRSFPVLYSQINPAVSQLESQLAEWGLTEQFADRLAEVQAMDKEASEKLTEYQVNVSAETDYKKKMEMAKEAETYINNIKNEIVAECDAIRSEAQAIVEAKEAANEAAYERLMAQISELEAYYNEVYAKFLAAAQTQPQGWSRTYGAQLAGISGAIQGMKGTVGGAYGRKELDETSTIDNYDSIKSQLEELEAIFDGLTTGISTATIAERLANGQVYDLSGRRQSAAKGIVIAGGKKMVVK